MGSRMSLYKYENLRTLIFTGKYKDAEFIINELSLKDAESILKLMAEETQNISIYSFVRFLSDNSKNEIWIHFMIDIFLYPFSYVEGAISTSLYHARELLKKNYTDENLFNLLCWAEPPENILCFSEISKIIHELKKMDSKYKVDESRISVYDFKNTDKFHLLVLNGLYEDAEEQYFKKDNLTEKYVLKTFGEVDNFCIYSFVRYLMNKNNTNFWNSIATKVLVGLKDKYQTVEGFSEIINFHSNEITNTDSAK